MLAGLFPGRIDLGLGRAPGTDPLTTFALQRDRRQAAPDDFPKQLAELLALPRGHACRTTTRSRGSPSLCPACPTRPSRGCSAPRRRARSGPPSSACPTRSPTSSTPTGAQIAARYRTALRRDRRARRRRALAVGVWAICADTDEEAQRLAASARMAMTLLRRGRLIAVPAAREGAALPRVRGPGARRHAARPAHGASARRRPCAPACASVADEYGADEVDRRHDHPRPRGAPALLRADRRGLRPRRRAASGAADRLLAGTVRAWPTPPLRRPASVRAPPASSRACTGSCWCAASPATSSSASTPRTCAPEDALVVREIGGVRWHRCLRCDSWLPLPRRRGARARAPARPRRDRAAAARAPAARQDRPAPDRDQPRRCTSSSSGSSASRSCSSPRTAATFRDRFYRVVDRPAGRRRGRRRARASTACSARSTSSSRCSPRGCTCSPR